MNHEKDIFQLAFAETPGGTVARVSGEIDMAAVPGILSPVAAVIDQGSLIELDMSEVEFIDSAGVRMMVDLARRAELAGLSFRLVAPEGSIVHRMVELTGIERLFTIVNVPTSTPPKEKT